MKKLLLSLLLMSPAFAYGANQDFIGGQRPAVWRSSQACGPVAWAIIATGTIIVHAVSVDSATVNQSASRLATFNSTTTPIPQNAANFLTTGTLTVPNLMGNAGTLSYPPFEYNAFFSSGVVVSKLGASCTTVWWDYDRPKPYNEGFVPWRP